MPIPTLTYRDVCAICAKTPQTSLNRPHSQHKTKRLVKPNLNKWNGLMICAKCRKALNKPDHVRKTQNRHPAEVATKVTAQATTKVTAATPTE